jgi:hypothetical protein
VGAPADPGAVAIPLAEGPVKPLDAALAAQLPALRIGALTAAGDQPAEAWALGESAKGGAYQLWRVDAATVQATLALPDAGPKPLPLLGAALAAGGAGGVRLVASEGALQVWRWSPGAGAFALEAVDPSVPAGQVALLGGPGGGPQLVLVLSATTAPVTRRLVPGAAAALQPGPSLAATWSAVDAVAWQPGAARALLSGLTSAGELRSALWRWDQVCSAP